ncbi:hypothetical protein CGLO_07533 [Colletotrichum gloeosporioides Cg-14]|uniref:Uncharacterized protein n=1 Tax=Colletotrichum gloeosporioides (strain Cg-14) TaxID=1237896 RepID=T0KIW2_COLGC|nr:hypothetical protein CGLO_07533 [Colletotrichum gloeosporioides Cg-14]
MAIFNGNNR